MFMQVSQIFQRCKSDANKQNFENKLNLTCQAQSTPKTIGILTKVFCTSGPNLVVLAQTGDELSHRQAQNGVNSDFEVKFELEGQRFPRYRTDKQVIDAQTDTHGHTHTQTQAMTIPEGQNWPQVKRVKFGINLSKLPMTLPFFTGNTTQFPCKGNLRHQSNKWKPL